MLTIDFTNVACLCHLFMPMSNVEIKNSYVVCHYHFDDPVTCP